MAEGQHTEDLWNVREGDTVEIETSEGEVFEAKCMGRNTENADPRTGEIRQTTMWKFDAVEYQPIVAITQGLKSSADDPEFPLHKEMWDRQQEGTMGFIDSLSIYGEMEA